MEKMYSAIVITCSDQESAKAFHTGIISFHNLEQAGIKCIVDFIIMILHFIHCTYS